MITKWKLFNFKSIRKETELTFRPLTILAGSNSSGKSTVLQSMLMISQTLGSRVGSRSVILNGPLTKLGQFDDIHSFDSEAEQILVGWEIRQELDRSHLFYQPYLPEVRSDLRTASCEISFDVDPSSPQRDLNQLTPRLFGCKLLFNYQDDPSSSAQDASISISRTGSGVEKNRQLGAKTSFDTYQLAALDYEVELDDASKKEFRTDMHSATTAGCVLRHFLPSSIARRFNLSEAKANAIAEQFTKGYWNHFECDVDADNLIIPKSVFALIMDVVQRSGAPVVDQQWDGLDHVTLTQWEENARNIPWTQRQDLYATLKNIEPDLYKKIYDLVLAENIEQLSVDFKPLPENLQDGITYLEKFFSQAFKYLGPLRDEPKPLYPLAMTVDPQDVGLRGELTASVLSLNKDRRINYLPSQQFATSEIKSVAVSRTLEVAVIDWLHYMGIAEGIRAQDRGKLGHELKVLISGTNEPHDLTHVGVGVSQVLPILVMCFVAEPDTTIIIEQPELHLHPKVQTLLADFFLSIAMLGKQIIVETHSEYIINRLRFRSAAAQEDRVARLLQLYFVEKQDGASQFRTVDVNKYGAITDWPDGFFDQSQTEAEEILRAATLKRKKEKAEKQDAQRHD